MLVFVMKAVNRGLLFSKERRDFFFFAVFTCVNQKKKSNANTWDSNYTLCELLAQPQAVEVTLFTFLLN